MALNIYDSMIKTVKDFEEENPNGPVAVEIAERESDMERSIHLRIAFQGKGIEDIEFLSRAQLKTVWKALTRYLNGDSGLFEV